ncbi:MAG: segregation/condensation protein A [Gammaproteobacteria bacterium]|nr:segregation/condensation protein A [Gammaproteobacteria bacterium]
MTENTEHNEQPDLQAPRQEEMPFAIVRGEAVTELPKDLYIPPDALEVILDAFEGPLDLLLYLIRKQNLDILDIPVAQITDQYVSYINLMQEMRLELAAEYLVMAAMLAEIKSRMLLPRPEKEEEEGGDPRAELVRRLQEYERYRKAAEDINELPRVGRDLYVAVAEFHGERPKAPPPDVRFDDLVAAFKRVLDRAELNKHHHITRELLSVRERMTMVLEVVNSETFTPFEKLFNLKEGRMGLVVTFMAILELIKESLLVLQQAEPYAPIHVKAAA